MDRQQIRAQARTARKNLPVDVKKEFDRLIKETVLDLLKEYQSIGIYLSLEEEVDTLAILKQLLNRKLIVASSRCIDSNLIFYQINSLTELKKGYYDLLEPLDTNPISKQELEVMLIPIIAFDEKRNRIGFGKGYYDRYLSGYEGVKIGLAYECQKVNKIPIEDWDVQLDMIVTETSIY